MGIAGTVIADHCPQWDRVTFSRLTKIYFLFSVLHCILQVIFQVQAFVANADAAKFLEDLIQQGNATDPGFTVYDGDLRMCDTVPATLNASSCTVVWDGHTRANVTYNISGQNDAALGATSTSSSSIASSSVSASSSAVSSSSSALSPFSSPPVDAISAASVSFARVQTTTALLSSSVISTKASSTVSSLSAVASSSSAAETSHVSVTTTESATRTITLLSSATATPKVDIQDSSDDSSDESDDESDSDDEGVIDVFSFHHRRSMVLLETQIRLALNGTSTVDLGGLYGLHDVEMPRKCLYALNWPCDMYVSLSAWRDLESHQAPVH